MPSLPGRASTPTASTRRTSLAPLEPLDTESLTPPPRGRLRPGRRYSAGAWGSPSPRRRLSEAEPSPRLIGCPFNTKWDQTMWRSAAKVFDTSPHAYFCSGEVSGVGNKQVKCAGSKAYSMMHSDGVDSPRESLGYESNKAYEERVSEVMSLLSFHSTQASLLKRRRNRVPSSASSFSGSPVSFRRRRESHPHPPSSNPHPSSRTPSPLPEGDVTDEKGKVDEPVDDVYPPLTPNPTEAMESSLISQKRRVLPQFPDSLLPSTDELMVFQEQDEADDRRRVISHARLEWSMLRYQQRYLFELLYHAFWKEIYEALFREEARVRRESVRELNREKVLEIYESPFGRWVLLLNGEVRCRRGIGRWKQNACRGVLWGRFLREAREAIAKEETRLRSGVLEEEDLCWLVLQEARHREQTVVEEMEGYQECVRMQEMLLRGECVRVEDFEFAVLVLEEQHGADGCAIVAEQLLNRHGLEEQELEGREATVRGSLTAQWGEVVDAYARDEVAEQDTVHRKAIEAEEEGALHGITVEMFYVFEFQLLLEDEAAERGLLEVVGADGAEKLAASCHLQVREHTDFAAVLAAFTFPTDVVQEVFDVVLAEREVMYNAFHSAAASGEAVGVEEEYERGWLGIVEEEERTWNADHRAFMEDFWILKHKREEKRKLSLVQRLYRGYLVRRHLPVLLAKHREARKREEELEEKMMAALSIQALIRGFISRRRLRIRKSRAIAVSTAVVSLLCLVEAQSHEAYLCEVAVSAMLAVVAAGTLGEEVAASSKASDKASDKSSAKSSESESSEGWTVRSPASSIAAMEIASEWQHERLELAPELEEDAEIPQCYVISELWGAPNPPKLYLLNEHEAAGYEQWEWGLLSRQWIVKLDGSKWAIYYAGTLAAMGCTSILQLRGKGTTITSLMPHKVDSWVVRAGNSWIYVDGPLLVKPPSGQPDPPYRDTMSSVPSTPRRTTPRSI